MHYHYTKYTKHEENWLDKRRKVFKRDGQLCKCCGSKRAYIVHHLTYRGYGKENLTDLLSVCDGCHESLHNWFKFSDDTGLVDDFNKLHGDEAPAKLGGFLYSIIKLSRHQGLLKKRMRYEFDYIEEAEL